MPSHRFFHAYLLFPLALSTLTATATAGDIQFNLEEPINGSIYSGVANIRGWAVSSVGINRVELSVDGTPKGQVPSGGLRTDVGSAYPTYPNSSQSGFSMAINYSSLTAGAHTISINVVDNDGAQKRATASFNVTRFNTSYITDPARVSLNAATITSDNNRAILINNLTADGQTYNARLEWRTEAQGFALTSISPVGGGDTTRWTALTNVCCRTGTLNYQVTIDGVTKNSTLDSCSATPSSEGFASTTAGAKNFVARAVSSACGVNVQSSGTVTMVKNTCYRFVLALEGQSLVNKFGTVPCPTSANADTLQEDTGATPMAIFSMDPADPTSAGQENWRMLENIIQP